MSSPPVYRFPRWFLPYLLCVIAAMWWGCNALSRWGGAAAGGAAGAVVGGPLGAAVGAVGGDAAGEALMPRKDPPTTVINVAEGGTVHTGEAERAWWMDWRVLAAGAFVFYRRAPLIRAVKAAGSPKALALNLWSALWASEKAAEKSKTATEQHKARRNVVVT